MTRSLHAPVVADFITAAYKKAGVVDTVKVVHVPKEANHVHLRLQNLADWYDSAAKKQTVSLKTIAEALWKHANALKPVDFESVEIEEMSLTGNMKFKEMWERKIKWATTDDDKFPSKSPVSYDMSVDSIDLEP